MALMEISGLNRIEKLSRPNADMNGAPAPLRLLHVIYSLDLKYGGPPEGLRQLAEGYRQEGVQLEVVSLDSPEESFLADLPFKVHALGPVKSVYGYSPQLLPWLRAHTNDYDAVIINGVWQYHGLATWRAIKNKLPYCVFTHGALDPWFQKRYPLKHLKKKFYWRGFQYPVLRDALAVLFTTETEKEQAVHSFTPHQWNGIVVPYGTYPPAGNPDAQKEVFFSQYPGMRQRNFLLFMGRIHEKKGCDLLIDAFSRIASSAPDLDIVMAGPDQVGLKVVLQKKAEKLGIGNRIHWPGLLQKDAKWGAFHAAEAFVLPSHQENFGISVAEALGCGKPVLISNKVNIWQDVIADGSGLVDDDSLEGVYRLLSGWLQLSEGQRVDMSRRALQSFAKRYSMRSTAITIRNIFVQRINAGRRSSVAVQHR